MKNLILPEGIDLSKGFFVAGQYISPSNKCLLVEDVFKGKINIKMPGGVAQDYAFYDQIFLKTLAWMLFRYGLNKEEVHTIIDLEKTIERGPDQRALIIEYVEETCGYVPTKFCRVFHTLKPNKNDDGRMTFNQIFFSVREMIGINRNSQKANRLEPVREIEPVPEGIKSFDGDIKKPRLILPPDEALRSICFNHKEPLKIIFNEKAMTDTKFAMTLPMI